MADAVTFRSPGGVRGLAPTGLLPTRKNSELLGHADGEHYEETTSAMTPFPGLVVLHVKPLGDCSGGFIWACMAATAVPIKKYQQHVRGETIH